MAGHDAVMRPQPPTREEVWLRSWCAIVACAGCQSTQQAHAWADACLDAYDERFPPVRGSNWPPPAEDEEAT